MSLLLTPHPGSADPEVPALGEFEYHADVGAPKIAGDASFDAATQQYRISGAGTNMWFGSDQFHFLWKPMAGDFILRARVEFVGAGADPHRKTGWMVRPGLEPDAPYVDCVVHGDGLTALQFRRTHGADTEEITLPVTRAEVLQLERRGTHYHVAAARFGEPFLRANLGPLDLGDRVQAGLFVCSHNGEILEQVRFHNVRITRPADPDFVPYQDYIGSRLELLDIHTGRRKIVLHSPQPVEAPNWTPDGRALIYNVSGRAEGWGRLCRFDLDTRRSSPINTEFAIKNNNDHVLSFDGSLLAISDEGSGQSTIYTLPVGGGTPRRITPKTPSYLHGWSPDGQWLVYTGGRHDQYDIYKIRSDGSGEEIRLTNTAGLDDGPEYSPDGRFIYFNSSRSGTMQLWRMDPEGSRPEQLTDDSLNNWFPHVSPDGQWIAFLSYPSDVKPTDHPYYQQVYLRLMPAGGGMPRVIAYVYGGQGTLNVPSWSPDSRQLAFVSNTDMANESTPAD